MFARFGVSITVIERSQHILDTEDQELAEKLCQIFTGEGIRLLTLTGPPGVGKTRLAQHVARQLLDYFDEGVFFIPLAPLREPELVAPLIAQALGLRDAGTQPLM